MLTQSSLTYSLFACYVQKNSFLTIARSSYSTCGKDSPIAYIGCNDKNNCKRRPRTSCNLQGVLFVEIKGSINGVGHFVFHFYTQVREKKRNYLKSKIFLSKWALHMIGWLRKFSVGLQTLYFRQWCMSAQSFVFDL